MKKRIVLTGTTAALLALSTPGIGFGAVMFPIVVKEKAVPEEA